MNVTDWEVLMRVRAKEARPDRVRQFKSGMVGIGMGQTARISVINTAESASISKSVWVQGWSNPHSEMLGQVTFSLEPGASAFLDLKSDGPAVGREKRQQIRATVAVLDDADRACVVTLEIFENETGKTTVFMQVPDSPVVF